MGMFVVANYETVYLTQRDVSLRQTVTNLPGAVLSPSRPTSTTTQ